MVVKKRKAKPLFIVLMIILLFAVGLFISWFYFTSPVSKESNANIEVVIPAGTSTKKIASILKEKNLIKSELVFHLYVKINHIHSLKASTYMLKKSMSMKEIIIVLEKGNTYNPNAVRLTFKEGKRITDYANVIAENTNHTYEEVISIMQNKDYIRTLIQNYWFLTDAVLQDGIYYPLEGYLAPDTYEFKDKEVNVENIIEVMLKEEEKNLEKYQNELSIHIHDFITMASILELEGTNTENRKMIAGIFNNRMANNMNLGSDVTAYYALQYPMTKDLTTEEFNVNNPYNTRNISKLGLPIGPICNPSISSIEASIYPTNSAYLYFVADKKGEIHYTKTLQEHEKKVAEIKEKGEWIW